MVTGADNGLQVRLKRLHKDVHVSMAVGPEGALYVYRKHKDHHWSMVRNGEWPPVRIAPGAATMILDRLAAQFELTEAEHIGMADGSRSYAQGVDTEEPHG